MRKRIVVVASAIVVGGIAVAGPPAEAGDCATSPASGCTVGVTAVVGGAGLSGVRTLGAVAPVALAGTSSLTGAIAVPVVETAATGDAAWSVTATASDLTSGGNTISKNNLSVADTTLPTNVGCLSTLLLANQQCTITGGGGSRSLGSGATLFSVAGENPSAAYTGTYNYAGLLTLNVPNGTPAGSYTGSVTLTLLQ